MPFAIIAPDDDVFVDNCEAPSDMHCPGVHYVNRSLPNVQDILNTLRANGTCSNLGPINITSLEINCATPINLPQTPTPSTNPTQENSYGKLQGYTNTYVHTYQRVGRLSTPMHSVCTLESILNSPKLTF